MSAPLYLCRARLRRDASIAALASLLVPANDDARLSAGHRLIWALFADGPDRRRDFLWRENGPGSFMTLSVRKPSDPHGLFDLEEPKVFAPALAPGDRLGFRLRANATVARPDGKARGKRADVVMNAIHALSEHERAEARRGAIVTAGRAWLHAQGGRHGFHIDDDVVVDGYDQRRVPRDSQRAVEFSSLDFEGRMTVRDPALFLNQLARGFGRAKAFGCGLMLIRRVR